MTEIDIIMFFLLLNTIGLVVNTILNVENNRILRKKKNKFKNNEASNNLWRTKEDGN